jgi:hypothetical protein
LAESASILEKPVELEAKCSACGRPVGVSAAGPFAGAEVVGALCPACTDGFFMDAGGVVLTLHRDVEGSLFPLGKVAVTPGAVAALGRAGQHAFDFLVPHARGDWGAMGRCEQIELTDEERCRGWEATDDTGKINKSNLLKGKDSIMSEYATVQGERVWVISYLGRKSTTVLLPEEY